MTTVGRVWEVVFTGDPLSQHEWVLRNGPGWRRGSGGQGLRNGLDWEVVPDSVDGVGIGGEG